MSTAAVLPSPASTGHPSGGGALTADRAAALLAGCASASRAAEIHTAAVRASVDQDKAVAFRLQRAYAASGRLDLAVALLRRTPDPTAVLYTSAIHAHTSRGLHRAALALLSEMLLSHGLLPTAHTLSASLPTCGGLAVGRALHGYAVKLAVCGEPYVATALLGIYARAGEVGRVRSMMRASGVQKKPGCSAVEVGRRVVEFVTGDRSHPRAEEIYAKLEEVSGMARARGHAPRTELVLHDLDDAAKERALAVHSENWGGERRWR